MGNKVLLISQSTSERSTDEIIDWIDYYGGEFIRLNGADFIRECNITIKNGLPSISNIPQVEWSEISVVWFRRWMSSSDYKKVFINERDVLDKKSSSHNKMNKFLFSEVKVVFEYLFYKIEKSLNIFDKLSTTEINKLVVLDKAVEVGLMVPSSMVLTDKEKITTSEKVITKPLSNGNNFKVDGENYSAYTSIVNLDAVPKKFVLSLIQPNIEKEFEIRSFLLDDKLYSMAIFSQSNNQTRVDFRKYDNNAPNRTVPFNLPEGIERKIIDLAKCLELKTGSFDLIYTKKGEYIFLEVNPGGQFGMVSYPCNYYLEEKVALQLIKESSNTKS